MKRKNLPAWQQVVLTVIESVPASKDGRDAWAKLNEEEKSAVNDYLIEHCGEEAEAKLEETCAIARPSRLPEWLLLLLGFGACLAIIVLWERAKELISWPELSQPVTWVLEALLWLWLIVSLFPDEHWGRMRQLWDDRADDEAGPAAVLAEMHRVTQMTRWQVLDKGDLWLRAILYGCFIAVRICSLVAFRS